MEKGSGANVTKATRKACWFLTLQDLGVYGTLGAGSLRGITPQSSHRFRTVGGHETLRTRPAMTETARDAEADFFLGWQK